MTLPNAHKGVQKLFIAEILILIALVLLLISMIAFGVVYGAYRTGGREVYAMGGLAVSGMLTLFGSGILPIIALILNLVGLRQASKDEPDYMNKAFWCAIWTLIVAVIAGVFQSLHWPGSGFFTFVSAVLQICMMVFSIMGVSEVTQNISRQDVADMGPAIITISVVAYVLSLIASIAGAFIGGMAAIISLGLMLVAYFAYLVFLGRAMGALANA